MKTAYLKCFKNTNQVNFCYVFIPKLYFICKPSVYIICLKTLNSIYLLWCNIRSFTLFIRNSMGDKSGLLQVIN